MTRKRKGREREGRSKLAGSFLPSSRKKSSSPDSCGKGLQDESLDELSSLLYALEGTEFEQQEEEEDQRRGWTASETSIGRHSQEKPKHQRDEEGDKERSAFTIDGIPSRQDGRRGRRLDEKSRKERKEASELNTFSSFVPSQLEVSKRASFSYTHRLGVLIPFLPASHSCRFF